MSDMNADDRDDDDDDDVDGDDDDDGDDGDDDATPMAKSPPAIVELPALEEHAEELAYTIEEGETLNDIAHKHGIYHLDVIVRYEKNAELFDDPTFKLQLGGSGTLVEKDDGTVAEGSGVHPGMPLPPGKTLYIPPRVQAMERATGKKHVFTLRPLAALPALPVETARRMAMELSLKAYLQVERSHTGSAKSLIKHKLSAEWRFGKMRTGAKLAVTGASIAAGIGVGIAVGATLANPLSLPIIIALAAGTYTVKKLVSAIIDYKKKKGLETYYTRKLFDSEGEIVHPDAHLSWWEKRKGLLWTEERSAQELEDKVNENFADAVSEDAELTLRRAVVHMRKARQLLEDDFEDETLKQTYGANKIERMLKNHEGRTDQEAVGFETCEQMVAEVKYGMKFLHEVDKFKNYLLPSITHLVFFIDEYTEALERWQDHRENYEDPILNFMRKGDHSHCMSRGKVLWKTEGGNERMCMRQAVDPEERKKLWKSYISPRTGLATQHGDTRTQEQKDSGVVSLCLEKARERLVGIAQELQGSIKINKSWAAAYTAEALRTLPPGFARYELFKRDLLERYDHPGLWRSLKHKITNYDMKRSKAEKGADFLSDVFEVGTTLLAGPFISDAFNAPLSQAGNWLTEYGLKVGASASKAAASSGALIVVVGYGAVTQSGKGLGYERKSELLPINKERWEKAQDEAVKDATGKDAKEGAINVDKLFKSVARHYVNATKLFDEFNAELAEMVDENGDFVMEPTCGACFSYASRLFEIHHEFDKMERHLVALLSFVGDLLYHAYELQQEEDKIVKFFDLHVKQWVSDDTTHERCHDSKFHTDVCYGGAPNRIDLPRHRLEGSRQLEVTVGLEAADKALKCYAGKPYPVRVKTDRKLGLTDDYARGKLTVSDSERTWDVKVHEATKQTVVFEKAGEQSVTFVAEAQCFAGVEARLPVRVELCKARLELSPAGPYLLGDKVSVRVLLEPGLGLRDAKAKVKVACPLWKVPEQEVELHSDVAFEAEFAATGDGRVTFECAALCAKADASGELDVHVDRRTVRLVGLNPPGGRYAIGDKLDVLLALEPRLGLLASKAKVKVKSEPPDLIKAAQEAELHADTSVTVELAKSGAGKLVLEAVTLCALGTADFEQEVEVVDRIVGITGLEPGGQLGTGDTLEVKLALQPALGLRAPKAKVKVKAPAELVEAPNEVEVELHADSSAKFKLKKAGRGQVSIEGVSLCRAVDGGPGLQRDVTVIGRTVKLVGVEPAECYAGGTATVSLALDPPLGFFKDKAKVKVKGSEGLLAQSEYVVELHESTSVKVELAKADPNGKLLLEAVSLCQLSDVQAEKEKALPVLERVAWIEALDPAGPHALGDKVQVRVMLDPPLDGKKAKVKIVGVPSSLLKAPVELELEKDKKAEVELAAVSDTGKLQLEAMTLCKIAELTDDDGGTASCKVVKRLAKLHSISDGPHHLGGKATVQVRLEPPLPFSVSGEKATVKLTGEPAGLLKEDVTVQLREDTTAEVEFVSASDVGKVKLVAVSRCEVDANDHAEAAAVVKGNTLKLVALDPAAGPYPVGKKIKVKVELDPPIPGLLTDKAEFTVQGTAVKTPVTARLHKSLEVEVELVAEPGKKKLELKANKLCGLSAVEAEKSIEVDIVGHVIKVERWEPADKTTFRVSQKLTAHLRLTPRRPTKAKVKLTGASFLAKEYPAALSEDIKVEVEFTKAGNGLLKLEVVEGCSLSQTLAETQLQLKVTDRAAYVSSVTPSSGKPGDKVKVRLLLEPSLGITADKARVKLGGQGLADEYTVELRSDLVVDVKLSNNVGTHPIVVTPIRGCAWDGETYQPISVTIAR